MQLTAGGRVPHHVGALIFLLVALLAVCQSAAACRSRVLLQEGSCSESSPCPNNGDCCSQFNFCGTGTDYCGTGCKSGPCSTGSSGSGFSAFFTRDVFAGWFPNRLQSFYTYEAFIEAAAAFPMFGASPSVDDQKREVAAFFGNVQQETLGLLFVEEQDKSGDYCDETNTLYPCASDQLYYGRGALQLSWNYNYGHCGSNLALNLLENPGQVAQSGTLAFKTALWFWMTQGCHGAIIGPPPSFASTIRIINGALECGQGFNQAVQNRVNAYTDFCSRLGVEPGTDLSC